MFNVAMIGMGNIALLFDCDKNSKTAYSHAKAIYMHKQFDLKYIVDVDDKNLIKAKEFFPDLIYNSSYEELKKYDDIDILVIATPTKFHYEILNFFKNSKIKLFFAEKPLFYKKEEYEKLDVFFKEKLVINYLRRFEKPIENLKNSILKNEFALLEKVVLTYVKGFKNNGSHFIDLINFLFDNPKVISSTILDSIEGFDENDLTYDVFIKIEYKNRIIPIHFIALNHKNYNLIEFKLYFEKQVVEYINANQKITYYDIVQKEEFVGYKFVSQKPSKEELMSEKLIYNAYEHIYQQLNKNKKNISSYDDELSNINFINKILENKQG